MKFRIKIICLFLFVIIGCGFAQPKPVITVKGKPFVNQAGYNLGEAKRFTVPGAADGTEFTVREKGTGKSVYEGKIKDHVGWFTDFNPDKPDQEYYIEVPGHGESVSFWIADHLMEKLSSRLAYQFFIDVRGGFTPSTSPANVTGGGPSRDGGGQGLEATFEGLLYASNPALFDRWNRELRMYGRDRMYAIISLNDNGPEDEITNRDEPLSAEWRKMPDLIKLLLWHAEFCYRNMDYEGKAGGGFEGYTSYDGVRMFGYEGQPLQGFDRQNLVDQLAATCAFYHSFLKPYMKEETYKKYRQACLDRWEKYDRQKEVRYWVMSKKWIDEGYKEFNEQGSAFGQGLLRNLMMYLCEKNEPGGQPDKFLKYAQACAEDIIKNWDFSNPWHMWSMRNAEHITPQALAMFLLLAPDKCPAGAKEKLAAWRDYIMKRTDNLWHYRTHSDTEWAHRKSKEVGTVCGLGGSMFAVAEILDDPTLRAVGWSQVNFIFGCNPPGAHLGNKSATRVALKGYWDGVENGWPYAYVHGTGELGYTRGAMDGSPTNHAFPYNPDSAALGDSHGIYGTEGWAISNRGWMATLTFSTYGSHAVRILDQKTNSAIQSAKAGSPVTLELKAALNQDWHTAETGYVLVRIDNQAPIKITVTETGENTGIFQTAYPLPKGKRLTVSYGYFGFEKTASLNIK